MKYPEDPEMTFEEGAKLIYDYTKAGSVKFTPAGLLERMTQAAMTVEGSGLTAATRAWQAGGVEEQWEFCYRKAEAAKH